MKTAIKVQMILYTDIVDGEQVCRDDLWAVSTSELAEHGLLPAPTELKVSAFDPTPPAPEVEPVAGGVDIRKTSNSRLREIAERIVHEWRSAGVGHIPDSAEFINAINQLCVAIDPSKESEWCNHCGCGNDSRGFAHLDSCPTNK